MRFLKGAAVPRDERNSCNQDEWDKAAPRYCALLSAAMTLKQIQGTYFAACLLAEHNVQVEHAVMVLALN